MKFKFEDNSTSNVDIIKYCADHNIALNGVFSKDLLPAVLKKGYYIVNQQDHDEGNGTHWTCFYYNKPKMSYYFDSFGFPPPIDVCDKIKPYSYNGDDIQDYNSSSCGWFCILFCKMGVSMLKHFTNDLKKNEEILFNLLPKR